jgi:hypothetical protein
LHRQGRQVRAFGPVLPGADATPQLDFIRCGQQRIAGSRTAQVVEDVGQDPLAASWV